MAGIHRTQAAKIWKLAIDLAAQKATDNGSPATAKKIKCIKPDWESIKEIVLAADEPKPKYGDTQIIEIKEYSDIVR